MEAREKMIGAIIKKVYVNQTKKGGFTLFDLSAFLLETDKGFFRVDVYGDCCSTGYIDHISLPYTVDNRTIKSLREVKLQGEFAPTAQEDDKVYGLVIELDSDQIFLEYRNSSNGYYGSDYDIEEIEPNLQEWEILTDSF